MRDDYDDDYRIIIRHVYFELFPRLLLVFDFYIYFLNYRFTLILIEHLCVFIYFLSFKAHRKDSNTLYVQTEANKMIKWASNSNSSKWAEINLQSQFTFKNSNGKENWSKNNLPWKMDNNFFYFCRTFYADINITLSILTCFIYCTFDKIDLNYLTWKSRKVQTTIFNVRILRSNVWSFVLIFYI